MIVGELRAPATIVWRAKAITTGDNAASFHTTSPSAVNRSFTSATLPLAWFPEPRCGCPWAPMDQRPRLLPAPGPTCLVGRRRYSVVAGSVFLIEVA